MTATVVYIEDHFQTRELTQKALSLLGHHAIAYQSAMEAISYVRSNQPDLIITDLHMPQMDGYTMISVLRSIPGISQIPIIAVTANASLEAMRRCSELGFDGFYGKPILRKDLQEIISKYLRTVSTSARS
jgi:CheY-like chemotaxis protein